MNNTNTADAGGMVEVVKAHPFERAGLGLAPFRLTGFSECKFQACPGAPMQPGTSCDYCGTGIMLVCHIASADGKAFKVGCDCVAKLQRDDNAPADRKLVSAVKLAAAAHAKALTKARNAAKGQSLAALLADDSERARLAALPHPNGWQGGFLAYAEWMAKNAGTAGKIAVLKKLAAL